ncbi:MAG: apolipoprotein N-acyltransferase [Parvibaculum sp.]|uniref:apolipoprotein N-acyltransferase n=1 Tax=Parvibaculum sp. TaxID=2024848 RepID=UPI00283B6A3C|nr:apolipoprotein N-acyltransferase [Parvibaculum sp.]MDR3500733.1 apolipoprotein N-acyltransferase [Parvibaculum sp.]
MAFECGLAAIFAGISKLARDLGELTPRRRWAVAFLAGALSVLALPPVHFFPILFFTFPILVWLIDGLDREGAGATPPARATLIQGAAAIGWWFGFGYFLFGLYWIGFAFMVDAQKFAVFMPLAVVVLPAGLALFTAAATVLARIFWFSGYRRIVMLAVSWTVLEWLRGHILTGFPWNLIGESFTGSTPLMQWAALTGAYGLSFIAVLIVAAPASFDPRADEDAAMSRASFWLVPVGALAALGFLWAGGAVRLAAAETQEPSPDSIHLRLVQPNIPQTEKWKPEARIAILGEFLRMSGAPTAAAPKGLGPHSIVVWPESALAIFLAREPYVLSAISRILPPGALLITGSVRGEPGPDGPPDRLQLFYNSLYVVNSDGRIVGTYDKFHLVPFGEYLPFHSWLERIGLHKLAKLQGSFDIGPGPVTLTLPGAPSVSPLICYEIIFPGAVVSKSERPAWIVNVTNDAWFGTSSGPYQHLSQARLRAVEQGLPIARAANTGISAVIDPYGRILARKALNTDGVVDAILPPPLAPTPYARFGDLILALMLLAASAAVYGLRRPVRPS